MIDLFGRKAKQEAVIARHRLTTASLTIDGLHRALESTRDAAVASANQVKSLEYRLGVANGEISDLLMRNTRLRQNRGLDTLRRLDLENKI